MIRFLAELVPGNAKEIRSQLNQWCRYAGVPHHGSRYVHILLQQGKPERTREGTREHTLRDEILRRVAPSAGRIDDVERHCRIHTCTGQRGQSLCRRPDVHGQHGVVHRLQRMPSAHFAAVDDLLAEGFEKGTHALDRIRIATTHHRKSPLLCTDDAAAHWRVNEHHRVRREPFGDSTRAGGIAGSAVHQDAPRSHAQHQPVLAVEQRLHLARRWKASDYHLGTSRRRARGSRGDGRTLCRELLGTRGRSIPDSELGDGGEVPRHRIANGAKAKKCGAGALLARFGHQPVGTGAGKTYVGAPLASVHSAPDAGAFQPAAIAAVRVLLLANRRNFVSSIQSLGLDLPLSRISEGTMPQARSTVATTAAVLACMMFVASDLDSQRAPGFGGIELRLGFSAAEDANAGVSAAVEADVGYVGSPRFRGLLGFDYFRAGIDRQIEGTQVGGNYSARGALAGVRLDVLTDGRAIPFVVGSIHAYSVDATSTSTVVEDLLGGFTVGAGLGAGLAYALADDHRTAGVVQVRRVLANNIGHWNIQLGFRYLPRGTGTWVGVPRRPSALRQPTDLERELAEEQQRRIAAERRLAEQMLADQPDTVAQRQEAERLAQEALLAEEQRRLEVDEQRRREAEERDRLAQERIAVAEREADEARVRAEAAERRAAETEQRMYDALLDLDRMISNITEIRETDRGLVIVLGQGMFASGQSALSARARDEVGRVAAVLAQFPEHSIIVEGHTDAVGQELANQRLSELRAESVRAAIIAEGISPQRVQGFGLGQGRPVAGNDTPQGRAMNRRVEIVLVGARRPGGRDR